MKVTERVIFSILMMPCCNVVLCWVNPRMPNYCPECGQRFPGGLRRGYPEAIMFRDYDAQLRHKEDETIELLRS